MLKVKVKKTHKSAVIPTYAKEGDAGMDLTAVTKEMDNEGNLVYDTGLAFQIPDGHVGLLFPRSSVCKKTLMVANSVGVIDSGYRGSVKVKFKPSAYFTQPDGKDISGVYEIGDRIAQIIIIPFPEVVFAETDNLSETERGESGFGSTN